MSRRFAKSATTLARAQLALIRVSRPELATSARGAWKRWPWVMRPAVAPSTSIGTTSSPKSSRTLCTGRTNSTADAPPPHALRDGQRRDGLVDDSLEQVAVAARRARRREIPARPPSRWPAARASATATPQLRAKAAAACVGAPAASNALATGGPRRSTCTIPCRLGAGGDEHREASRRRETACLAVGDAGGVQAFGDAFRERGRQSLERARGQLLREQFEQQVARAHQATRGAAASRGNPSASRLSK